MKKIIGGVLRLGLAVVKFFTLLVLYCFALVWGILRAVFSCTTQTKKARPQRNRQTANAWWESSNNTLDNDIEQVRHTDGMNGK